MFSCYINFVKKHGYTNVMLNLKFSTVNGKSFITIHNNRALPYIFLFYNRVIFPQGIRN